MPSVIPGFQPIDLNRGTTMRKDPATGIEVYMYKDDPGRYLTIHGRPVAEELAGQVGFPVAEHRKERLRRERKKFAASEIDKEMEMGKVDESKVIDSQGDYSLVDAGHDRVNVVDSDGQSYTPRPVPVGVGRKLLNALSGFDGQPQDPQTVLLNHEKEEDKKREAMGIPPLEEQGKGIVSKLKPDEAKENRAAFAKKQAEGKPYDGADEGTVQHGEEQFDTSFAIPSQESKELAKVKADQQAADAKGLADQRASEAKAAANQAADQRRDAAAEKVRSPK